MSRWRTGLFVAAIVAIAIVAWLVLGGSNQPRTLSGYIEGDDLYLAAPVAGTVASVSAVEGTRVTAGQPLFTIAPATLTAQGQQAQANVTAAQSQIASAEANVRQADAEAAAAEADAEKARSDLARLLAVRKDDAAAVAGKDIDAARAALGNAQARIEAARRTADACRAQVAAARAQTEQAKGGRNEVAIRESQLSPVAPSAGRVDEVFYQPGEWAAANQPIVSLLPDAKVKVRFFVPEKELARYRVGRTVRFSCDGCAKGLSATIRYVSPQPEFTPPVIFSRDSRDRLVFMVEANPPHPENLQPGMPVDVEPLP
ncbi:MAG TPA: HlyD family efflux transporter periplasmic adaptor subunit [Croceibacterium sp.]|jgi:HlyD family secretion protein